MTDQKHTKETWSYDEDEQEIHCDVLADRGGDPLHICEMMGPKERKDANGKRIVDCVNACAGIENPQDLRTKLTAVTKQRDELRRACEYALPLVKVLKIPVVQKMIEDVLTKTKGDV